MKLNGLDGQHLLGYLCKRCLAEAVVVEIPRHWQGSVGRLSLLVAAAAADVVPMME